MATERRKFTGWVTRATQRWRDIVGRRAASTRSTLQTIAIAPPEGEMPKIKGPFWVVLVFVYSKGAVVRT